MAGEMVERVARAIQSFDGHTRSDAVQPGYDAIARAAIAAMREPTEAQAYAGRSAIHRYSDDDDEDDRVNAIAAWWAMIDEALREPPPA